MPSAKRRVFYGWYVAVVCFFMAFTVWGFTISPRSIFLGAITEDLGIPRTLYSISESIRFIATAVANLFFGTLVAKYGARRLIAMGIASSVLAMIAYATASHVAQLYVAGALLGLGLAWTTTSIIGHLVENWFASNKGTVMGIVLSANGLGGAVAAQLGNYFLTTEHTLAGWRMAYLVTAGLVAAAGIAAVLVVRNHPKDMGLSPLSTGKTEQKKVRGEQWDGITFDAAKRKLYFYVGLLCIFLTGMVLQGMCGVAGAHMRDSGIEPDTVANVLSLCSLILMITKMAIGVLFDKFGLRPTLLVCAVAGTVCIAAMASVNSTTAYLYSFVFPFALPLETIMLPLIARDLFGKHSYSKIMGIIVSANTLGYAVGVPLMNVLYDLTGTYYHIMLVMAAILAATAIVMQLVITAARKDRAAIMANNAK